MADSPSVLRSRIERCLVEPGLWVETTGRADWQQGQPALFLDRDGTINVDTDYPRDPAEIALRPGIIPVIAAANAVELPVVVVTNQSGIARGYFGWPEFAAVNDRVLDLLRAQACTVDLVLACAYYPAGSGPLSVADHPMRKPNPGMLHLAAARFGLGLSRSLIVGDKLSDMEAGRRAGLAGGWLIGAVSTEAGAFPVSPLNDAADTERLVQEIVAFMRS